LQSLATGGAMTGAALKHELVELLPHLMIIDGYGASGTGGMAFGASVQHAETFPIVDGRRLSIPGDRGTLAADGQIVLLGRDSLVVNSGGEKIFIEEVEDVIRRHPDVREFAAGAIARFKAPRAVLVCDRIPRHAPGKADYRWARAAALDAANVTTKASTS
jgi:fatty-acyl-CoA synthase